MVLNEIADDFLESVTVFSAEIAKHRKDNDTLSAKDIKLHLEQNWGLELELEEVGLMFSFGSFSSKIAKVSPLEQKESEPKKVKIGHVKTGPTMLNTTTSTQVTVPTTTPQMYYHNQRVAIKHRMLPHYK